MTDRELLEAAAKAAGIEIEWVGSVPRYAGVKGAPVYWDPLTDDGDALRLAVKLGMNVDVVHGEGSGAQVLRGAFCSETEGDDIGAATRRAITRAAAAMAG